MDKFSLNRTLVIILTGVAIIGILGMAVLSAVLLLKPAEQTTSSSEATVAAIAASTMSVIQTEQALNGTAIPILIIPGVSTPEQGTAPLPTFTPTPTSQNVVVNTPLSIFSPTPSPTPRLLPTTAVPRTLQVPTVSTGGSGGSSSPATSVVTRCNWAELVEDITIPEGTVLAPSTSFTKIWKVKNIGTCAWTRDYSVVFDDGTRMEGRAFRIPSKVNPGETINVSIEMLSPENEGDYTGEWLFKTPEDVRFGTGSTAKNPLTVDIEVNENAIGVVYDFVLNYCAAEWSNKTDELDCPGDEDDEDGFVIRLDDPALENRIENEPALWTQPEAITDGLIQGKFPEYRVQDGDHFRTAVGCLEGYERCEVIFQLKYQIGDGPVLDLGRWDEKYDEATTDVDVDLSSLAGQKVKFILMVKAAGSPREDAAFWLVPHIHH